MENIVEIWVLAIQNRNRENERIRHAQMIGVVPAPADDEIPNEFAASEQRAAELAAHKEDFDLWATEPTVDPDR